MEDPGIDQGTIFEWFFKKRDNWGGGDGFDRSGPR
jgi:hypothetical protein